MEPCITELNVITMEPVDVFVYDMKNSDKIFHFEDMEVDELARTTGLGQWSRSESGHIDGVFIYEDSVIISNYF